MSIEKYAMAAKKKKEDKKKKNEKEAKILKEKYFSNKTEDTSTVSVETTEVKKRGRKKKTVEVETDGTHSPRKRAPRGSKPKKKYFEDYGFQYVASKIIFRIMNEDGTYEDVYKEFEIDVTFNAYGKVNSVMIFQEKKYKITEVITTESYLTFVIEPYFEKVD